MVSLGSLQTRRVVVVGKDPLSPGLNSSRAAALMSGNEAMMQEVLEITGGADAGSDTNGKESLET